MLSILLFIISGGFFIGFLLNMFDYFVREKTNHEGTKVSHEMIVGFGLSLLALGGGFYFSSHDIWDLLHIGTEPSVKEAATTQTVKKQQVQVSPKKGAKDEIFKDLKSNLPDHEYLRKVEIVPQVNGGYEVTLHINVAKSSETTAENGAKDALNHSKDMATYVYTHWQEINHLWISVYADLVDTNGRTAQDDSWADYEILGDEAYQVKWSPELTDQQFYGLLHWRTGTLEAAKVFRDVTGGMKK